MALALSRTKNYSPPLKGLNTRYALPTLNEQEASVLTNFQINNSGILETYPGYVLDGSPFPANAASFIRSLFNFRRGTSIDWLLMAANDTTNNSNTTYSVDIKYTAGDGSYAYITHNIGTAAFTNGNTAVTGTNTQWDTELKAGDKIKLHSDTDNKYTEIASVNSKTSLTLVGGGYLGTTHVAAAYDARKVWNNAYIPRFTTFNNVAVITNGVDQPQAYDGTSLNNIINTYSGTTLTTSGSTMPTARYVFSHKNRLFFAGTLSRPSGLFWTHANDQTTIDGASNEDIFPQDGGSIVSATSFADSIIILKSNGRIYQVIGNFDDSVAGTVAAIRKLDYSEYIGIIAEQSAVVHNNSLYFMSENGIYKIDRQWLQVQKVSWIVDPEIQNFSFQLAPSVSKSFPFNTKTEWDSGTHLGTYSPQAGTLNTFFDDFRQTDAAQSDKNCSIAIAPDNTIHIAYVPASDNTKITYVRYLSDGTVRKEDTGATGQQVLSLSIGVAPNDLTVGIAYVTTGTTRTVRFVERTPDTSNYTVFGTWGASVNLDSGATTPISGFNPVVCSLVHSSGGVPYVASVGTTNGGATKNMLFSVRTAGQWQNQGVTSDNNSDTENNFQVSLVLDASNNIFVSYDAATIQYAYKSLNGGATWTLLERFSFSPLPSAQATYQAYVDHAGNFYTVYSATNGNVYKRNHTGTATVTMDSNGDSLLRGYISIYQNYQGTAPTSALITPINVDYWYRVTGSSPNQVEKYVYESTTSPLLTNTLVNPTSNVINIGSYVRPGMNPMVNNGQTIATVGYGTNSNEIVIRRITFYGHWTSAQETDSGLTAWGNYVVTGSSPNGGTLSYQQALASGGTANSFTNVVPPVLVSGNAALNIAAARVFWTIGTWAGASIASIVLNYTGAGVSATQIVGTEFFNELYFAATQVGHSNNNVVLESDISDAYLEVGYPVSSFVDYKTFFYGGSSLQGDLYKLKQGYTYNGSTYACDYQSKEDFLDSPIQEKDFFAIYVLYQVQSGGTFTFSYRTDAFAGSSTWTSTSVDQTKDGIVKIDVNDFHKRSIQLRVQSTANGFATKILGFVIVYGLNNIR